MAKGKSGFYLWISASLYYALLSQATEVKTWTSSTNFAHPRNWDSGELPCANERVIFPASKPVITFMPDKLSLAGMVLPKDGQLIFPENANITITGGKSNVNCPAKDVHFNVRTDFWYDPLNWNITSPQALPNTPSRRNEAIPEAFRVPCATDSVVFPVGTSFRTLVHGGLTVVASLQINGKDYTAEEFQGLLASPTGKLLFPNDPLIQITGSSCQELSGCSCGNDHPSVLPKICSNRPICPSSPCFDTFVTDAHCCPVCGAYIQMQPGRSFEMERLNELYKRFLSKETFKGVDVYTAKTYKNEIHTFVVDAKSPHGTAKKLANDISDILLKDIDHAKWYSLRSVRMFTSNSWNSNDGHALTSEGMSSGGVAALVVIIIAVAVAVTAFYIYKKRYIPGFSFARFDLYSEKIELELGTTPHDELEPELPLATRSEEKDSNAFSNPIYGSEQAATVLPSVEEVSREENNYVENPMFMIFEKSTHKENEE